MKLKFKSACSGAIKSAFAGAVMVTSIGTAQAALVQFVYSGNDAGTVSATGSMVLDDLLFNGTNGQFINQSLFSNFSMTMMDSNTSESHSYNIGTLNTDVGDNWRFDSLTNPLVPAITGFQGFMSTGFYGTLAGIGTGVVRLDHPENPSRTWRVTGAWTFDGPAVAAIPLPTALPLFGTGLGILGFLGWRRRRKAV